MPVLRITVRDGAPVPEAGGPLDAAIRTALRDPRVGHGPVTLMVHGFKYAPGVAGHCPHDTIFSEAPRAAGADPRLVSWPRHLGAARADANRGLHVSVGWPARGSIWQAYRGAAGAGAALASLVASFRAADPVRPVHAIGHSLGARVILDALARSERPSLDWAILLAPAEFAATARAALASPAGRSARVLAVTSRENDLFDLLLELFVPAPRRGDAVIGRGGLSAPNALTLQLDHRDTLAALGRAGHRVAPATRRVCHWSPYLRPGAFPLYRALLEARLSFDRLRTILPEDTDPRWARLRPRRAATAGSGWVPSPQN
ncbi:hypothetical protein SAMN05444413_104120 [Roseivivax marinus]|uniref:hypothetical protein n=1 Tax=Roseivivax marinus TaxID=1379903 RepID=UPI0008C7A687|nr:hypothetical protein [Roseivivax marinus]SEK89948.1 hypothetical protein SAMN05444413_104120 [Roseivivax marinus]